MRGAIVPSLATEVPSIENHPIEDQRQAEPVEQIERSGHGWIGLEKLPAEPLRAVDDAQHIESPAHGPGRARRQTADIRSQTGFDYVEAPAVPTTPLPDAETLALLRGRIMDELAETYPAFARAMLQAA